MPYIVDINEKSFLFVFVDIKKMAFVLIPLIMVEMEASG